jgi:hypothetical protein
VKPSSAKSKGRLLQQWVVKQLLSLGSGLTEDDLRSTSMGATGVDVLMSSAAKKQFPISVECKNIAAFAGYKFLEQSEFNAKNGEQPIAVVKANRKKPIVLVDAEYFFQLVRKANGS